MVGCRMDTACGVSTPFPTYALIPLSLLPMSARYDLTPWTDAELTRLSKLCEASVSGPKAAQLLNDEFHGGKTVRSDKAIYGQRTFQGWHLGTPSPVRKRPKSSEPTTAAGESVQQTVEVQDSGDQLTVRTFGSEVTTIDELVARAKIDLTKYEVDRPETSMHETTVRDIEGKIRKVQNFRIVARFRLKQGPSATEQVEVLVKAAWQNRKPLTHKAHKPDKSETMQAIVIADPHIAKHAWGRETGHGDYDIPISVRLLRQAASEQIAYGNAHGIGKRYLFLLGDVLHYDTPNGSTTSGTPLERDGRVEKMLEEATRALFDIISQSAETHPTEVVMVGGNHDALLSVALRHILSAYYRNDKRVTVEMGATTRKYLTWGKCLIGLTHGDKAQKSLGELMAIEAREQWGKALLRDIHHGHRHSEAMVTTKGGVTVRQHLALCPPDGWHAAEGYVGAPRGLDSYLYHKDGYLRGTWRSPVLDG